LPILFNSSPALRHHPFAPAAGSEHLRLDLQMPAHQDVGGDGFETFGGVGIPQAANLTLDKPEF